MDNQESYFQINCKEDLEKQEEFEESDSEDDS